MDSKHELIICIVNNGFSDDVMTAAREVGAKGGTVINARGTAREEAEKKYNISIHPEKELILIVVNVAIKDDVMSAIYKKVGLATPGQGIVFSLPIDETAGITGKKQEK